jgi:hypothetical protein
MHLRISDLSGWFRLQHSNAPSLIGELIELFTNHPKDSNSKFFTATFLFLALPVVPPGVHCGVQALACFEYRTAPLKLKIFLRPTTKA